HQAFASAILVEEMRCHLPRFRVCNCRHLLFCDLSLWSIAFSPSHSLPNSSCSTRYRDCLSVYDRGNAHRTACWPAPGESAGSSHLAGTSWPSPRESNVVCPPSHLGLEHQRSIVHPTNSSPRPHVVAHSHRQQCDNVASLSAEL